ncbi:MAG TPA: hypothetical protein DIT55_03410 [Spirochaetaceae bacterium]|nr:hypothetical protein [Spirochaetaceae bacterium]
MTRKEYIDALAFGLEGFDDASRRDIILEIEDHIDELALKHPEMAEDAIVAGLEKPEILAASLCREAGIPGQKRAYGTDREDDGRQGAERGHQWGKARITIDGEDLGDFFRRAFDIAKLFKESKGFDEEGGGRGSEEESDERANGGGGRTLRFKDIPIGSVREIVCGTKSADLRVFLSTSGLSVRADGDKTPSMSIKSFDGSRLEIATNPGPREPDILELGVPGTVDTLSLRTLSGDVLVEDRLGDLEIRTASGDVEVKRCSGDLSVTTASGDVGISECSENIHVQTASGSVDIDADEGCDGISVSTASGDIVFSHPEDFDALFTCATVSGEILRDGEEAMPGRFSVGDGLTPVRLGTASGDIHINRS